MSQYFPDACHRAHCIACRDTSDRGARWRIEISRHFRVPGDDANFTCPHGYAWDEKPPPPAPVPGEVLRGMSTPPKTLEQLEKEIAELGNPPWLAMKLQETKTIIGDEQNCSACVTRARCGALQGYIDDWKRLECTVRPETSPAP